MVVEIKAPVLNSVFVHDVALNLHAAFYPLGFPLAFSTNSDAVMAAARSTWGAFTPAYPGTALSLEITVLPGENRLPPRPTFRSQQHLMSIVCDAQNQVIIDLNRGCATAWVTEHVANDADFLRQHFLESSAGVLTLAKHLASVHGGLVARGGSGVLLCGESSAGKSTLSYACARRGWTFITDDGTFLVRDRAGRHAVGNPQTVRFREDATRFFPELAEHPIVVRPNGERGWIIDSADLPITTSNGCVVNHVVVLRRSASGPARMTHMGPGDALAMLEEATLFGPREVQESQKETYRRLLGAGLWELHYSALDEAVSALNELDF